MALAPQKFRELLFQLLYSLDFTEVNEEDLTHFLMAEFHVTKTSVMQMHERRIAILEKQKEIDEKIAKASTAYEFARIPAVEKNIIRLGVYEMLYDETIPPKVAIAEAIRLTRKFSSPESGTFVNAILDEIYKHDAV